MPQRRETTLRVGVDTGGTFTDIVFVEIGPGGRPRGGGRLKVLSTPGDPAQAVLAGLAALLADRAPDLLTYGTTVATNAMLERRGARTALVTTTGFEDVLEIGRQARPDLYDLEPRRSEPLVPAALRFGAGERTLHDGSVAAALSAREVARLVAALGRAKVESVAVCLLHAVARPDHERAIGAALDSLGIPYTLSHRISPAVGEYERTSTTVANAYVQPKVAGHIHALAQRSRARRLRVMQSSGGAIGAELAAAEPVRTMLSGPAGGVAAAAALARRAGLPRIVTLDMGGTSTDVALVDGEAPRRADTWIGGFALRVPCLDIHTVGAGGGSIAFVDEGGALRVGPRSAGADPGPACYGRGSEPTVTDANVVLGRLPASRFLGGSMTLDAARARRALEPLRRAMRARSVEEAAEGVVRVVEGNMERAIRAITVQRGQDPRDAALLPFGGAAGLHGCALAEECGLAEVLVPRDPGLLSAIGVLEGRVVLDRLVAMTALDPSAATIAARTRAAAQALRRELRREGFRDGDIRVDAFVRARYRRQSIELEVPLEREWRRRFDEAHQRLFHTSDRQAPVEVVGLRLSGAGQETRQEGPREAGRKAGRASALRAAPLASSPRRAEPPSVPVATAAVVFSGKGRATAVFERDGLQPGMRVDGPAIVAEYSSTTLVAPGWSARVDSDGNLRMKRRQGR